MRVRTLSTTITVSFLLASAGLGTAVASIPAAPDKSAVVKEISMSGAVARFEGTKVFAEDTFADDKGTRTNWKTQSGETGGVSNHSGFNTTVTYDTKSPIVAVQVCTSGGFLRPMECSQWSDAEE